MQQKYLWLGGIFAAVPARARLRPRPDPGSHRAEHFVARWPAPGGGSNALGYDPHQWTYWQTQTDPRGNMYGYDVHGNYWTY